MKNKWSNYALKDGKVKESYLREHIGRDKKRKTAKASSSNSPEQSREKQEEVKVSQLKVNNEASRKEEPSEAYKEGRQGIQISDQGRCETEETNHEIKNGEEVMKKETMKHKKHEASETKAYEKKEDRKEVKKESKKKK